MGMGLVTICLLNAGATYAESTPGQVRSFEFSSGGAYHPEGFGEWRVKLNDNGTIEIVHQVGCEVREWISANLAPDRIEELRQLVNQLMGDAELQTREGQITPGTPIYSIALEEERHRKILRIPLAEAGAGASPSKLVEQIRELIVTYTGETPVLR